MLNHDDRPPHRTHPERYTGYVLRPRGRHSALRLQLGLGRWKRQYDAWKADNTLAKPSQAALRRQLNAVKREQFPWMLEVTKNAPHMVIIQLGRFGQWHVMQRTPQIRAPDRQRMLRTELAAAKRLRLVVAHPRDGDERLLIVGAQRLRRATPA